MERALNCLEVAGALVQFAGISEVQTSTFGSHDRVPSFLFWTTRLCGRDALFAEDTCVKTQQHTYNNNGNNPLAAWLFTHRHSQ